jgi:hypothetical protein
MEITNTILKTVRVAKDSGLWNPFFQSLGQLPGTEYLPTERERQRVRDHSDQKRGQQGE